MLTLEQTPGVETKTPTASETENPRRLPFLRPLGELLLCLFVLAVVGTLYLVFVRHLVAALLGPAGQISALP